MGLGKMTIYTRNGEAIQIDEEDHEKIRGSVWYIDNTGYPRRGGGTTMKGTPRLLHRIVMDAKAGEILDHINGDRTDCRKSNLRLANAVQNARNRRKVNKDNFTSRFKGVTRRKLKDGTFRWLARVKNRGVERYIGLYNTEEEAAQAYNLHAAEVFDKFVRLNIIEPKPDA